MSSTWVRLVRRRALISCGTTGTSDFHSSAMFEIESTGRLEKEVYSGTELTKRWASIAFTVNFRNNVFKYTIQGEFPAERGILRFATMRFDDSSLSVQLILGNDTSINSCVKEVKVNVGCQLKYEAIKQAFSDSPWSPASFNMDLLDVNQTTTCTPSTSTPQGGTLASQSVGMTVDSAIPTAQGGSTTISSRTLEIATGSSVVLAANAGASTITTQHLGAALPTAASSGNRRTRKRACKNHEFRAEEYYSNSSFQVYDCILDKCSRRMKQSLNSTNYVCVHCSEVLQYLGQGQKGSIHICPNCRHIFCLKA